MDSYPVLPHAGSTFGLWILLAFGGLGTATGATPHVFYTDLESGPNTGGENNGGAFLTIYGNNFGSLQGSVSIGGGPVGAYRKWTNTSIVVQLGPLAVTGGVVVMTPGGTSNAVPFTVRDGRIFFVAPYGSDTADGSFGRPWATAQRARDGMLPGDITYLRNGVTAGSNDDWSSCLFLAGQSGAPNRPLAIIGYPGETAVIGNINSTDSGGCDSGLRTKGEGEHYWTFAELSFRGASEAVSLYGVHGWRVIANDLTCPLGDGPSACFGTGYTKGLQAYGNRVHDTGRAGASALYHGIYLGSGTSQVDLGWNQIFNVRGCRGIQVFSSEGDDIYNVQIHDNVIHDTQCDGIILATVDPSKPGGISVFNNVVYNAGKGPATPEKSGAFFCINVQGWSTSGAPGAGIVEVFNNTLFNCGTYNPGYDGANGAFSMNGPNPSKRARLRNNIFFQNNGAPYFAIDNGDDTSCSAGADCPRVYGAANLFSGAGPAPLNRNLFQSVSADPLFANAASFDFHLQSTSPARGVASPTDSLTDFDGNPRGPAFDIGALQFSSSLLTSFRCEQALLVTPAVSSCTATLSTYAPPGGVAVSLSTDNPAIRIPAMVVILEGQLSARVSVSVDATAAPIQSTLYALVGTTRLSSGLLLLPPGNLAPVLTRVTSAASYSSSTISPGEVLTLFGFNLDGTSVQVMVDDAPVAVIATLKTQVSAIAPPRLVPGATSRIYIVVDGKRTNVLAVDVSLTNPALFTRDATGTGQLLAFNSNHSLNSPQNPEAQNGLLTFYATGLGPATPEETVRPSSPINPISVTIAGVVAVPRSILARPSYPGLYELQVPIPPGIPTGPALPVIIRTIDKESQPSVTVSIQ